MLPVSLVRPVATDLALMEDVHGVAAEGTQRDARHAVPLDGTDERSAHGYVVYLESPLLARRNHIPNVLLAPQQSSNAFDPHDVSNTSVTVVPDVQALGAPNVTEQLGKRP